MNVATALSLPRGRGSAVSVAAGVVASAVLALTLLVVTQYPNVDRGENERSAARILVEGETSEAQFATSFVQIGTSGLRIVSLYGEVPSRLLPPGLERSPLPGEAFVSPAVQDLCESESECPFPGRIVATVGDEGLTNPSELFVYAGLAPQAAPDHAVPLGSVGREPFFGTGSASTSLAFALFGLAPSLTLLAVALRYGARRSARRTLTLRTLGMDRRLVALDLAVPTLAGATVGSILGALGYSAALNFVDDLPFVQSSYNRNDLEAGLPMTAAVVAVVLLVVSVATFLAAFFQLARPLREDRTRPRTPTSVGLAVLLAIGLALFALNAALMYRDQTTAGGGPLMAAAILLFSVGLMGGSAPLAALASRQLPLRTAQATVGLGARRVLQSAAATSRATGPLALIVFFCCTFSAVSSFYETEAGDVFSDSPSERITFATRDGATVSVRPDDVSGAAFAVQEVVLEDPDGVSAARAIIATCEQLEAVFLTSADDCSGEIQALQISTGSSATSGTIPWSRLSGIEALGGAEIDAADQRQRASLAVDTVLPFSEPTLLIPPSMVSNAEALPTARLIGSVPETRQAFRNLSVIVAQSDPTTFLELPSVRQPDLVGAFRWLAIGSVIGGTISLIAMITAFADLRAQQMRGYAMLAVLGWPERASRAVHVSTIAIPATVNVTLAAIAAYLAGLGHLRTIDDLPHPAVFAGIAVAALTACLVVAAATSPRHVRPQLISSLIRPE